MADQFLNDPTGFWGGVIQSNQSLGIASILPSSTQFKADNSIKDKLLKAAIEWTAAIARWNGAEFPASIADAGFTFALSAGGDQTDGKIALIIAKSNFGGGKMPSLNDVIEVFNGQKWAKFYVSEVNGANDPNEQALALLLDDEHEDHD